MFIDTHCHLNFEAFEKDYRVVVEKARKAGVNKILTVGVDIETSKRAVEIANELEGVKATVGFHPHHCRALLENSKFQIPNSKKISNIKNQLRKLARDNKVVGIGECGLDYYEYKNTKYPPKAKAFRRVGRNLQKQVFGMQIQLTKELNLPMVIHNRKADMDVLDILDHFCKSDKRYPTGVFHCISGSKEYVKKVLEMGFYIGIDGNVTYSKSVQELAKIIPLEKLVLETDSPLLSPEPNRRLRNEPISVKITAEFLARLKNISLDKLKTSTTQNAEVLFKL